MDLGPCAPRSILKDVAGQPSLELANYLFGLGKPTCHVCPKKSHEKQVESKSTSDLSTKYVGFACLQPSTELACGNIGRAGDLTPLHERLGHCVRMNLLIMCGSIWRQRLQYISLHKAPTLAVSGIWPGLSMG